MHRFQTKHDVDHGSAEMFDLVMDVERYPEFLPLCEDLKVISRDRLDGQEVVVAEMVIGYRGINERFRSRIESDRAARRILVRYVEGPFSHMENRWSFEDNGRGGCTVAFSIEYKFRSMALQLLMHAAFDKAILRITHAFEARADQVYGKPVTAREH